MQNYLSEISHDDFMQLMKIHQENLVIFREQPILVFIKMKK